MVFYDPLPMFHHEGHEVHEETFKLCFLFISSFFRGWKLVLFFFIDRDGLVKYLGHVNMQRR